MTRLATSLRLLVVLILVFGVLSTTATPAFAESGEDPAATTEEITQADEPATESTTTTEPDPTPETAPSNDGQSGNQPADPDSAEPPGDPVAPVDESAAEPPVEQPAVPESASGAAPLDSPESTESTEAADETESGSDTASASASADDTTTQPAEPDSATESDEVGAAAVGSAVISVSFSEPLGPILAQWHIEVQVGDAFNTSAADDSLDDEAPAGGVVQVTVPADTVTPGTYVVDVVPDFDCNGDLEPVITSPNAEGRFTGTLLAGDELNLAATMECPPPVVKDPTQWEITAIGRKQLPGNTFALLPGGCFAVHVNLNPNGIPNPGAQLLAPVCDTDNDAFTLVGTLPANGAYMVVATQAPPGYSTDFDCCGTVSRTGGVNSGEASGIVTFYQSLTITAQDEAGNPVQHVCYQVKENVFGTLTNVCDGIQTFAGDRDGVDNGTVVVQIFEESSWTVSVSSTPPVFETPPLSQTRSLTGGTHTMTFIFGDFDPCALFETTHVRDVTIYYGYLAYDDSVDPADMMAASDHFTEDGGAQIKAGNQEVAIVFNIDTWTTDPADDMDWVLAPSEGLDAEQNLRDQYEAFRQSQGGSALLYESEVDRGTISYLISGWSTHGNIEGCSEPVQEDHYGYVRVHYVQLNASFELLGAATLAFRAVDQDGNPIGGACFWLTSPTTTFIGLCTGIDGTLSRVLESEGEPVLGEFALEYKGGPTRCTPPDLPDVTVEESDFGATIDLGDLVFTCEEGGFDDCWSSETHTRDVSVYFGTASAEGDQSLDSLELSDHLAEDLAQQIESGFADERVADAILAWALDGNETDDIEWILGTPEGLDAQQALLDAFAAFAEAQGGLLALDDAIDHGTEQYLVEGWTTFEANDEFCSSGFRATDHWGYADVTYIELNATVTIPEMATLQFRVVDQDGNPIGGVCFNLVGQPPVPGVCTQFDGVASGPLESDDEPVLGTYELSFSEGPTRCTPPDLPDVVIEESDFGTTIDLGDIVFTCEEGGFDDCLKLETHTRDLTAYYGTVAEEDGSPSQSALELTDLITVDLADQIAATYPDARVQDAVLAWIRDDQNDMEWFLDTPEGLDAEQALLDAFATFAEERGGILSVEEPIDRGTEEYILTNWSTLEDNEFCSTGTRQIDHEGYANVSYVELNATVEPDPCAVRTVTHERDVTVYYGTVSVTGGSSQNGLELSAGITADLGLQIATTYPDERVAGDINSWATDDRNDMEWVLDTPDGLDAQQALLDAFEAFATGKGELVLADSIGHGTEVYFLDSWTTAEESPPGCPNPLRAINNEGYANVTFTELNATVEIDDDTAAPGEDDDADDVAKLPNTGVGPAAITSSNANALLLVLGLLPLIALVAARRSPASFRRERARSS